MHRGAFFPTNMIIKNKKYPSEKRVLFVAIAPQGYCFGTHFFVSVYMYNRPEVLYKQAKVTLDS